MSRRILKLCVASLHNILCFPDVILWKDSRLESFHGNPFPSVIHLSVIIIVIVKLLINLTVDHHHHPYHAGHHKDKDNMCVSSGLDWACPELMWRSASMCLHSVLNFIMIIVLIKIKASNQDDHTDQSASWSSWSDDQDQNGILPLPSHSDQPRPVAQAFHSWSSSFLWKQLIWK